MKRTRRAFLNASTMGSLALLVAPPVAMPATPPPGAGPRPQRNPRSFPLEEATVREMQQGLTSGRFTAQGLARKYLQRIDELDRRGPSLRSVLELNPDALAIARDRDHERHKGAAPTPLHGIPVLIKDNIDTGDRMMTTAGSLALLGSRAPRDSFVAKRLREAGAVILGKTNLSEWANFRGSRSTSGWSGRGGQTRNPYVLDRNPSGSSSGSAVAVAANLCAVAVGTETDGSIISPSSMCGIVGLKPTVGRISRAGIIPISSSQDTAGPMTRTVMDAALLLAAIAGPDPRDPATAGAPTPFTWEDVKDLKPESAHGLRVGVLRKTFPASPRGEALLETTLRVLRTAGIELVDRVEIPRPRELGDAESRVMLYEFKAGLNAYLAGLGEEAPVHNLRELIEFNERHREQELRWFGQELLVQAEAIGPLTDQAYLDAVETCRRLARVEGIDAVMNQHRLDAFLCCPGGPASVVDPLYGDRGTGGSTSPSAPAGYPCLSVPAGFFEALPVAIAFFGRAWSEKVLLQLGLSFETASQARQPPRFLRSLYEA